MTPMANGWAYRSLDDLAAFLKRAQWLPSDSVKHGRRVWSASARAAIVVLLLTIPIGPLPIPGNPLGLNVIHVLLAASAFLALMAVLLEPETRKSLFQPYLRAPAVAMALLVLTTLASAMVTADPRRPMWVLAILSAQILIALAIPVLITSVQQLVAVVSSLVIGASPIAVPALWNVDSFEPRYGGAIIIGRSGGLLGDPNELGAAGVLLGIVALALATSPVRIWLRLLGVVGVLGGGAAILVSLSRGAWFGLVIGLVALGFVHPPSRGAVTRAAALVAAIALFIAVLPSSPVLPRPAAVIVERFGSVREGPSGSPYDVRARTWALAWQTILRAPMLGVGPGNFREVSGAGGSPTSATPRLHAHNGALNQAAETGLLGLAASSAVVVTVSAAGVRGLMSACSRRRRLQEPEHVAAAAGAGSLAALVGLSAHMIVDYPLRSPLLSTIVWILGGVVLASTMLLSEVTTSLDDQR